MTGTVGSGVFTSIYDTWFGRVRQWTRALGGDRCDAEDLAQDVFLVVHRLLPRFDGKNLGAWLYRITVNQVRDHRRRFWTRTRVADSETVFASMRSTDPTPSTALETKEQLEALALIVARLNASSRATYLLFTLEAYTSKEIAAMQQAPLETVHCRIKRTRQIVTAQMAAWRSA